MYDAVVMELCRWAGHDVLDQCCRVHYVLRFVYQDFRSTMYGCPAVVGIPGLWEDDSSEA